MSEHQVPPGFGPALASARAVPQSQRVSAILTISAFCVAFALYSKFRGLDWSWSIGNAVVMFAVLFAVNFKANMRAGNG